MVYAYRQYSEISQNFLCQIMAVEIIAEAICGYPLIPGSEIREFSGTLRSKKPGARAEWQPSHPHGTNEKNIFVQLRIQKSKHDVFVVICRLHGCCSRIFQWELWSPFLS